MRGTLAPSLRASLSPIAIACLRLVTFLPERPDLSLPCFISRMARSTFFPDFLLYFRVDFLRAALFLRVVFLRVLFLRAGERELFLRAGERELFLRAGAVLRFLRE